MSVPLSDCHKFEEVVIALRDIYQRYLSRQLSFTLYSNAVCRQLAFSYGLSKTVNDEYPIKNLSRNRLLAVKSYEKAFESVIVG
jgi:hypothetical protein